MNWKTRFIQLITDDGDPGAAYSLLLEYVISDEDIIEAIGELSCLALEFIDDSELVFGLDSVVRRLEEKI